MFADTVCRFPFLPAHDVALAWEAPRKKKRLNERVLSITSQEIVTLYEAAAKQSPQLLLQRVTAALRWQQLQVLRIVILVQRIVVQIVVLAGRARAPAVQYLPVALAVRQLAALLKVQLVVVRLDRHLLDAERVGQLLARAASAAALPIRARKERHILELVVTVEAGVDVHQLVAFPPGRYRKARDRYEAANLRLLFDWILLNGIGGLVGVFFLVNSIFIARRQTRVDLPVPHRGTSGGSCVWRVPPSAPACAAISCTC